MSTDSLKRIDFLRNFYRSQSNTSSSDVVNELRDIKNEMRIANNEKAIETAPITNAAGSPYLSDQQFQLKNIIFNSAEEVGWREVKSSDQLQAEALEQLKDKEQISNFKKRMNII